MAVQHQCTWKQSQDSSTEGIYQELRAERKIHHSFLQNSQRNCQPQTQGTLGLKHGVEDNFLGNEEAGYLSSLLSYKSIRCFCPLGWQVQSENSMAIVAGGGERRQCRCYGTPTPFSVCVALCKPSNPFPIPDVCQNSKLNGVYELK